MTFRWMFENPLCLRVGLNCSLIHSLQYFWCEHINIPVFSLYLTLSLLSFFSSIYTLDLIKSLIESLFPSTYLSPFFLRWLDSQSPFSFQSSFCLLHMLSPLKKHLCLYSLPPLFIPAPYLPRSIFISFLSIYLY